MLRRDGEGVGEREARARQAGLARRLVAGGVAGLVAGLVLTLALVVLRLAAGVPLPVELISDRLLPLLSVRSFVRLQGRVGGPLRGKNLAFLTSFGLQLGAAVAGGVVFGSLHPRLGGRNARRRFWTAVFAVLLALWLAFVVLLWPALSSNYRGLPPGLARLPAA